MKGGMPLFTSTFGRILAVAAPLILMSCAGTPNNLSSGPQRRLMPCPASPNCVSTEAADPDRKMAPLPYRVDRPASHALILAVIQGMPRTTIVTREERYIHAEFRSRLFGFVDDVEFVFDDDAALIRFRSASRTGYADMGVNRKRMEAVSEAYHAAVPDDIASSPPAQESGP
jgi:uncharacterized protein (DUF1499 family)